MRSRLAVVLLILASGVVFAGTSDLTFSKAKKMWEDAKGRKEYQMYAVEFAQFNNHFHLDKKDGCYRLDPHPVELMLVIGHDGKSQYAHVEQVLSSVDNAKSACFRNTYRDIPTKIPPFLPLVIQLHME